MDIDIIYLNFYVDPIGELKKSGIFVGTVDVYFGRSEDPRIIIKEVYFDNLFIARISMSDTKLTKRLKVKNIFKFIKNDLKK